MSSIIHKKNKNGVILYDIKIQKTSKGVAMEKCIIFCHTDMVYLTVNVHYNVVTTVE